MTRSDPPLLSTGVRGPDRTLLIALALVGLFVAVVGGRIYARAQEFYAIGVFNVVPYVDIFVGLAYIWTGLVAWRRRPENRVGVLMTAMGFTWFIGAWGNLTDWNFLRQAFLPVAVHVPRYDVFRLGLWFEALNQAILIHLILSFPTGRLGSRPARVVAGAAYANVLLLGFLRAATFDVFGLKALGYPHQGVLGLWIDANRSERITRIYQVVWVAILLVVLAMLLHRWRHATKPRRRALTPVWFAGSVVAASLAVAAPTLIGSNSAWQVGVCCTGGLAPSAIPLVNIPASVQQALFWLARIGQVLVPVAFLIGVLRMSLARTRVSDFIAALGDAPPPGRVRDAMATALGDPSLELVFWIPAAHEYVDVDGAPVTLPGLSRDRSVDLIQQRGEPLGAIVHDPELDENPALIRAVGAAARLAIENERLHAQLRAQLEEVRASRARIVAAADAERRRLERDIHDGAQQRLVTASLALTQAQTDAGSRDPEVAASLARAAGELKLALTELRELARGIHPAILTQDGLGPALESLAARSPIPTVVEQTGTRRFSSAVEATAYFVVSEALANVAKHARAGRVSVALAEAGGRLRVEVRDDGIGSVNVSDGSGLRGLADRVEALGGELTVVSPANGGTQLVAEIPCE